MIDLKEEHDKNKFSWGDPILIKKSAPHSFHAGEFASVCGFYKITSEESAKEFQCNVGDCSKGTTPNGKKIYYRFTLDASPKEGESEWLPLFIPYCVNGSAFSKYFSGICKELPLSSSTVYNHSLPMQS